MDSYITIDGIQHELRVPSGSQSGLKLNTSFTVASGTEEITVADENSVYTIDFDLRKSIVDANGQPGYFLKPVLRLVQNINTGNLSGTVALTLLEAENCLDEGNVVYIFAGAVTPDDYISTDNDDTDIDPPSVSMLSFDAETEVYSYEFSYLSAGTYTLALTCSADLDDELDNQEVVFESILNGDVTINAGNNSFPIELPSS